MAVRFNAPIYTYENILDKAGIYLKVEEELSLGESDFETDDLVAGIISEITEELPPKKSVKELYKELEIAVANENYELAAKIRDEISKRS